MAKPIRKTPTLNGKEAESFVSTMLDTKKRRINKVEKDFISLISKK